MSAKDVANQPLMASINKTTVPARLPKTLKVLVAPALPLPCLRTSTPKYASPYQIAVGIEPNKYAAMVQEIIKIIKDMD